ncbi:MAG: hypothetical protein ACOVOF_05265 [Chryseotalea sp.]|jgi:hypothetical protein
MMRLFCFTSILFFVIVYVAYAQHEMPNGTPSSLTPGLKPVFIAEKKTRKIKRVQPDIKKSAEYQFYDRVEKIARQKKRWLRKAAKEKYTNPVYFGHNNLPKKRAVHKMKYCWECGIRH